ncbi:hypothetical protein BO70DRAFT_50790 [Aspergillus heteromorphus CBS 117.55]|uniref:Uncharacterized protein n=1 Tax=Aspergillus heteromorphus CBS 117.55 TaxID=1448321 RepID=A0A317VYZ1_9EURO|nr:uncharacterized protein BO70DRAFT_50790 [Aspergillus heteromorphus CBS 117.55]PWY79576.1 hypothetical protein BO70DRAFT_50790 [Aspergillus heteromorphus CBS 117.55]
MGGTCPVPEPPLAGGKYLGVPAPPQANQAHKEASDREMKLKQSVESTSMTLSLFSHRALSLFDLTASRLKDGWF